MQQVKKLEKQQNLRYEKTAIFVRFFLSRKDFSPADKIHNIREVDAKLHACPLIRIPIPQFFIPNSKPDFGFRC